jgi:ribosomal protein L7Ae-like RNA K-turn-binding protein
MSRERREGEGASEADALKVLGLARRAGHAAIGTEAVRLAARKGRLVAVVVARDIGENALHRLGSAGAAAPAFECGTMRELGAATGRGRVAVVGLTDPGLARLAARGLERARGPDRTPA